MFNIIVPTKLITKLQTLGLNTSLCNWILDFLMGRPQVVRVGNNISTPLILNTGAIKEWCQENNLILNVNKTKEMIVDFRKQQREHPLSP